MNTRRLRVGVGRVDDGALWFVLGCESVVCIAGLTPDGVVACCFRVNPTLLAILDDAPLAVLASAGFREMWQSDHGSRLSGLVEVHDRSREWPEVLPLTVKHRTVSGLSVDVGLVELRQQPEIMSPQRLTIDLVVHEHEGDLGKETWCAQCRHVGHLSASL